MRRILPFCALIALSTFSSAAFAERVIKNDSLGETVNATVASAQIIQGEAYEAVFDIPSAYLSENSGRPLNFLGLRVLMVNGTDPGRYCGRFSVELYAEGNNVSTVEPSCLVINPSTFVTSTAEYKAPGAKFFDLAQIPVTNGPLGFVIEGQPSMGNVAYTDLLVSAINMNRGVNIAAVPINTSRVRVVLRALDEQCGTVGQGAHYPVMVTDQDGISARARNFLYGREPNFCPAFHDYHWEDFAPYFSVAPGDFAMRLIVDYDDGGSIPDMGMADAGGSDMGTDMAVEDMNISTDMAADTGSTNNATNNATNNETNNSVNNGTNNAIGALSVTSISPASASNARNTDVVILGTGFEPGAEVSIGATIIGVTDTEPQRIRASIPSGLTPGTYDLIVSVPSGASTILQNGFTVTTSTRGGGGDDGCGCGSTEGSGGPVLLLLVGLGLIRRRRR